LYIYNSIFHNEYNMIKLMLSIYATFKHRSLLVKRLEIIKKTTDKYKSYSKVVLNSFPYLQPGVLKDLLFTLRGCVRSLAFCGSVGPKKSSVILDRNNLTHDRLTGRLRAESRPGC